MENKRTSRTPKAARARRRELIANIHCASLSLKSSANNIMKIWV
jgi:hypothetical protein